MSLQDEVLAAARRLVEKWGNDPDVDLPVEAKELALWVEELRYVETNAPATLTAEAVVVQLAETNRRLQLAAEEEMRNGVNLTRRLTWLSRGYHNERLHVVKLRAAISAVTGSRSFDEAMKFAWVAHGTAPPPHPLAPQAIPVSDRPEFFQGHPLPEYLELPMHADYPYLDPEDGPAYLGPEQERIAPDPLLARYWLSGSVIPDLPQETCFAGGGVCPSIPCPVCGETRNLGGEPVPTAEGEGEAPPPEYDLSALGEVPP